MQKRKGIYNSLENEIQKCYYKDENDATEFALQRIKRKKDLGVSYDQKAESVESIADIEDDGGI